MADSGSKKAMSSVAKHINDLEAELRELKETSANDLKRHNEESAEARRLREIEVKKRVAELDVLMETERDRAEELQALITRDRGEHAATLDQERERHLEEVRALTGARDQLQADWEEYTRNMQDTHAADMLFAQRQLQRNLEMHRTNIATLAENASNAERRSKKTLQDLHAQLSAAQGTAAIAKLQAMLPDADQKHRRDISALAAAMAAKVRAAGPLPAAAGVPPPQSTVAAPLLAAAGVPPPQSPVASAGTPEDARDHSPSQKLPRQRAKGGWNELGLVHIAAGTCNDCPDVQPAGTLATWLPQKIPVSRKRKLDDYISISNVASLETNDNGDQNYDEIRFAGVVSTDTKKIKSHKTPCCSVVIAGTVNIPYPIVSKRFCKRIKDVRAGDTLVVASATYATEPRTGFVKNAAIVLNDRESYSGYRPIGIVANVDVKNNTVHATLMPEWMHSFYPDPEGLKTVSANNNTRRKLSDLCTMGVPRSTRNGAGTGIPLGATKTVEKPISAVFGRKQSDAYQKLCAAALGQPSNPAAAADGVVAKPKHARPDVMGALADANPATAADRVVANPAGKIDESADANQVTAADSKKKKKRGKTPKKPVRAQNNHAEPNVIGM